MLRTDVVSQVWKLLEPWLESEGVELVEVEFLRRGKDWVLTLYIDKEGGVSLDDCQHISHQVGKVLDVEEIISHPYVLEVSSPGIDRPLRKREDFVRFAGHQAYIATHYPIEHRRQFRGKLAGMHREEVLLVGEDGITFHIPYTAVKKAHLKMEITF